MRLVLAHGGTTSGPTHRAGTRKAAKAGLARLDEGPLEAVVEACRVLEDNARFHAGLGGTYRMDGKTLELDAGVCCSDGRYGAVGALTGFRNPVLAARRLADLPVNLLAGEAAAAFARRLNLAAQDLGLARTRREWRHLVRKMAAGKSGPDENEFDEPMLRDHWNYGTPFEEVFPQGLPPPRAKGSRRQRVSDTVGAVATDGHTFAAAASTSGMTSTLRGRVGDAAILGAGILATEHGAVACSGNGDHILRMRLASRVEAWLAEGMPAAAAAERAVSLFRPEVDAAVTIVARDGHAAQGNRTFAWSVATG
ncbi:MAG TPA: isoaspartyl peptidase/L-asparaginase [Candidatus Thermoplasmatota archaeon]|nr:isoaspartyl peptidase/L-asparaginase [Candidatus Thermoplasmatota archaeon]